MDTRKFAMNYGAVLGILLVLVSYFSYIFGIDEKDSMIPSILNNGLTIGFIAYAVTKYRDIFNNGYISFSSSLKLGTTVAFFSSVILAFYTFLFISYINTDALNDIISMTEQAMLESNPDVSDEELDLALEMTSRMMQPHWIMMMGILGGTFMGFLYSLAISFFVKKTDNNI